MRDSFLVDGVAFKKTFSYAGFEQQPKSFDNPKVFDSWNNHAMLLCHRELLQGLVSLAFL